MKLKRKWIIIFQKNIDQIFFLFSFTKKQETIYCMCWKAAFFNDRTVKVALCYKSLKLSYVRKKSLISLK